jgi:hypothetical protein
MLITYTHVFNELGHALNLRKAHFYDTIENEWIRDVRKDRLDSYKNVRGGAFVRYYSDPYIFFVYLAGGIILWVILKKIEDKEHPNKN